MSDRIPALDGLRGIAATGILVMHAFPAQLFWAWSLVDLFFVLSGFLITGILLRLDLESPLALRNFWMRRVIRIWPVYYVALLAALGLWGLQAGGPETPWWRAFTFLQFTENYDETGPPAAIMAPYVAWFRHSWSLAVEEQFYLLWPLLLWLCRRNRAAIIGISLALIGIGLWLRSQEHLVILLLTRADGLALGAILAVLQQSPTREAGGLRPYRPLFALCLLVPLFWIVPYLWDGYTSDRLFYYADIARFGNWAALVTAFAAFHFGLVGLVVDGALPRLTRLLGRPPLLHLGLLSYAIYMYSGPVPELVYRVFKRLPWQDDVAAALAGIMLTLLAAQLSRSFMERPLERLKSRFPLDKA